MNTPNAAAYSSPMQCPVFGAQGKYVEAKREEVGRRTDINHKLRDLQYGDVPLPPDLNAPRALEIVPVHHDVHGEVQCNRDPGDGGAPDQLDVAEEGGCAVVVRVQEAATGRSGTGGKGGTHIVKQHKLIRPSPARIANRMEDAILRERRQDLLEEQRKQGAADEGENEVVDNKWRLQLECRLALHELAAAEDHDVVCCQGDQGALQRCHGGDARLEVEFRGRLAG
ncbi:uncharacterized protein DSM5745_06866 [Aspergillus mulundensis]|uniref:Uncharacterized protein n=1 Tax=Aspergillus mulundensis TaxID=1810919 RepID=A0A3D8RSM3_9EURO|nr:hypothetical protein DSM5745_06866 [Aspergillus mulundensis]RDW76874.1 hypothetical protein DSM5745_06866 [Aspergillus mulundensis]